MLLHWAEASGCVQEATLGVIPFRRKLHDVTRYSMGEGCYSEDLE